MATKKKFSNPETVGLYYNAVLKVIDDQRSDLDALQDRVKWSMSTAIVSLGLMPNSDKINSCLAIAVAVCAVAVIGTGIFCLRPRTWYWTQRIDHLKEKAEEGADAPIASFEVAENLHEKISDAEKSLDEIARGYRVGLGFLLGETVAISAVFVASSWNVLA